MSKYYKALDSENKITALNFTPVSDDSFGEEISKTEFCMMKCAIKVFLNGEDPQKIRNEEWWQ